MKAAAYCATRNLYHDLIPSIKSLLLHSDVEKIYLLIEDDDFPEYLPPECKCINVSQQKYFIPGGPNWNRKWTWMVLMRCALSKILPPDLDRVLSLDADTIVEMDISDLWDLDLTGWYLAAAREPLKSTPPFQPPRELSCVTIAGILRSDLLSWGHETQRRTPPWKWEKKSVVCAMPADSRRRPLPPR